MRPHFQIGDHGETNGIEWCVTEGSKTQGDLVMWLRCPEWRKPKMELAALLADFHDQVEENLYPPPRFKGGEKFREFLRDALRYGWRFASDGLERERAAKRAA